MKSNSTDRNKLFWICILTLFIGFVIVARLPTSYARDALIDKVTAHNFIYEQVQNTFLIDSINRGISQ